MFVFFQASFKLKKTINIILFNTDKKNVLLLNF